MSNLFKSILIMLFLTIGVNQSFAEQKITFYHYDLLGSPVATTDENGDVIWRERYEPWGKKTLNQDESNDNVRGYTGHVNDKETGLTYMQARYYDPEIGRFMGIDPVEFKEENPIMFNRYAYANNNPYKFTDPNGEEAGSEDGNDAYNDALASHTFGVEGISDFDRSAISYGNVSQASTAAQSFMRGVPDSQYAKEMGQLGGVAIIAAGVITKGKTIKGSTTKFGRIQSRINVSRKGFDHVVTRHINPNKSANKSQFTMSQSEVKALISSKSTVNAPVTALSTGNFSRTVTSDKVVGNLAHKFGGAPTKNFSVITDRQGNLLTAHPSK